MSIFVGDKFDHFFRAGKAGKGGVLNFVILSVFDNIFFIDDDQRGDIFAPVADDDGVCNVGRELQQVFDILRRYVFAAGRDDEVFLAVGDFEITFRIDFSHISGMKPAALQRLRPLPPVP